MSLADSDRAALQRHLAGVFDADSVEIAGAERLSGGAIQENWALDLSVRGGPRAGEHAVVLRTDSPSGVAVSHSRAQEFELLQAAWDAGVAVPEPLHCCTDPDVLGKPFCLMGRVAGTAVGQKVVKDTALGGDRERLAERLGRELARIHAITPQTHPFGFLDTPRRAPAEAALDAAEGYLDALARPRPVLEWALRWLRLRAPGSAEIVLAHRDFRTGNYLVDADGLTAILDWEFAGWSDPHEDLGWFCAMCWRFSAREKEAGGIGSRASFYQGYRWESGRAIDPAKVRWWEIYAHLRWGVIALQQVERYLTGGEDTLTLGLTGLRLPEIEVELLRMTAPDAHNAPDADPGAEPPRSPA